jgi:ariadne-1
VEARFDVLRWCPGIDCGAAVERLRSEVAETVCGVCSVPFCFDCGSEPHRPMPCSLMKQWDAKSSEEGPNVSWIVLNTKPCPKCRRPVEKNAGCMVRERYELLPLRLALTGMCST